MAAEQFHSKLAGVSFENDDGTSRVKIISQYAKPGATIFLKREPDNPHGATATSAWIRIDNTSFDLVQIGYLKTELTNELAPKMDAGDEVNVMISEITGGTRSKKNVGVNIRVEVTSSKSKRSMTSQPQEIDIETPKVKKLNVFDWMRILYFKKRRLFWLVITGVLVSGCCLVTGIFSLINPSPSSEPPAAEELTVEELVAQMMETEQPAGELIPTLALIPTEIAQPTNTPEPTPAPQPFVLTGNTPNVFEIDKWPGPALIHIKYEGGSNFIADSLDANNENTTLMGLANEIGYFEGWRLIDTAGQHTTRIQIELASGPYTLEVFPVVPEYVHSMTVPGQYTGQTPDLILLNGDEPDLATFVYNGDSNFIVDALDKNLRSLSIMGLVNEIGAFEGTKLMPAGSKYIYISYASGPYSIDVQGK